MCVCLCACVRFRYIGQMWLSKRLGVWPLGLGPRVYISLNCDKPWEVGTGLCFIILGNNASNVLPDSLNMAHINCNYY